ncbi:MAG: asparagine synthetase B, partial [Gammaproteobacteria bacterium]
MLSLLVHRGPDDEGIEVGPGWGLGHRRLAILDLSSAGRQPMERDGCLIVHNGEVYNYLELREELEAEGVEFRTSTDTEVILRAYQKWGASCLERFIGMWAFAIQDTNRNEVFCSRDRFGIKPLYYQRDGSRLEIASEIKALVIDRQVKANPKVLATYLVSGLTDHTESTFFAGVKQLPPSSWMRFDLNTGGFQTGRFYDLRARIRERTSTANLG